MPNAIGIFARAAGVSEAELFKMMEQGQVLASDILPKVAKEMSRVANSGGALEAKYKTARVAQGRFFNQLEQAQNTLFQGGMDEGIGSFFNDLAHSLRELEPLLKVFGKIFKVAFTLVGSAIRLVTVPFQMLGKVLNAMTEVLGEFSTLLITGIFSAMFLSKIHTFATAMKVLTLTMAGLAGKITAVVTALLLLEDVWMSVQDSKANTVLNQMAGNVDAKGQPIDKPRSMVGNMFEGYRQYSPLALLNKLVSSKNDTNNNTNVNVTVAADSQGLIKVVDQRVGQQFSFAEAVSN